MDTIVINGVTYYVPSDYSSYIVQVGNTLTLNHSGSITLYSTLVGYQSNDNYPRITLSYGNTGRYITRSSSGYTSTSDLVVNSYELNQVNRLNSPMTSLYLQVSILAVLLLVWLKRG